MVNTFTVRYRPKHSNEGKLFSSVITPTKVFICVFLNNNNKKMVLNLGE